VLIGEPGVAKTPLWKARARIVSGDVPESLRDKPSFLSIWDRCCRRKYRGELKID